MGGLDWEAIRSALLTIGYEGGAGFEPLKEQCSEDRETLATMTRDFALTRFALPRRMGIVCHGNIARSQVLHHLLAREVEARGLPVELFSCGTAEAEAYDNVPALLEEVSGLLRTNGVKPAVERCHWTEDARKHLLGSDWILAADEDRQQDLIDRLPSRSNDIALYYDFIGEAPKGFIDTFDHQKGRQDPERFAACFQELQRIAGKAALRLEELLLPRT
jgi:protein-tyrosine-phosphatase